MLKPRTIALIAVIVLYVLLLWAWASLGFPTVGQICNEDAHYAQPYCTTHYYYVVAGYNFLWWIGENTATLTVFGTFILAAIVFVQLIDARKSNQRQLRAYVLARDGKVSNFGTWLKIEGQVRIENYGQTPARDVVTWVGITVDNWPVPKDLGRPTEPLDQSKAVLGPNARSIITAETKRPLTPLQVQKIRSGAATIYLFGEITYVDVFGQPQITEFRFAYGGPAGENTKGKVGACIDGNRAS
jgi:hypothetical protein